jgi:hypothetical protein
VPLLPNAHGRTVRTEAPLSAAGRHLRPRPRRLRAGAIGLTLIAIHIMAIPISNAASNHHDQITPIKVAALGWHCSVTRLRASGGASAADDALLVAHRHSYYQPVLTKSVMRTKAWIAPAVEERPLERPPRRRTCVSSRDFGFNGVLIDASRCAYRAMCRALRKHIDLG